ncbi:hypothetical protein Leryth_027145 [Lithospermum erythrorhizon]|nr:hypothetical protein Leryth_027145 [Lithospermum erythrorhizon]
MLYSGGLCTRDRLINWGMIDSNECVFCGEPETAEHLFFECRYSACIWRHVLQRMNKYRAVKGWSFESQWYSTEFKALGCAVYFIWWERNARIFAQQTRTSDQVMMRYAILLVVKLRVGK